MARSLWRVGLTGGIGSGKSTVCGFFSEAGAAIVDADAISKAVTGPGGSAIASVREAFGDSAIDAAGGMDRAAVRARVFSQPQARQRLERIVHPLVLDEATRQESEFVGLGYRCILFDIPLLAESTHWRGRLEHILVVDCHQQTQVERVIRRSGLSEVQVRQIIGAQAPRALRLSIADSVIWNDGLSTEQLATEVHQLCTAFGL